MAGIVNVSKEIEKATRRYLLEKLEPGFYASDFSQQHFDLFLDELIADYGEQETIDRMATIRTCIHEHFKLVGQETEVRITDRTIKVVKKFKVGIKSIDIDMAYVRLDALMHQLVENEEKYALMDNLLCFDESIVEELFEVFSGTVIAGDSNKIKPLIRASMKRNFELDSKDIVLFLRQKLYIRGFVDPRVVQGENQRFLGVSPEEMEALYKRCFPENFEDILLTLAVDVFDDALDFGVIDNMTFKSKYINVFRTLVDVAMASYTSKIDREIVKALNGYVLRIHFDALLLLCAETLVDMVMKRDKNADAFLRFYNGETILDANGNKIKKPFIIDADNNTWNYNSIFSIMTQYLQYLKKYEKQAALVKEAENFHTHAASEVASMKQKKKSCIEQTRLRRIEHDTTALAVRKLESIENPNKDERSKLRHEKSKEREHKKRYDRAFDEEVLVTSKLKNLIIAEQNRLKQFRAAQLALANLEQRGADLERQQEHILAALSKALIFR